MLLAATVIVILTLHSASGPSVSYQFRQELKMYLFAGHSEC